MKKLVLAAVFAILAATPGDLLAQFDLGGTLNWGTKSDLGLGVRGEYVWPFEQGTSSIASFDYFFPKAGSYWELNLNLAHTIPVTIKDIGLYAGAGLNWARIDPENREARNDFGMNLLGGIKYFLTSVKLIGEVRWELGGGDQVVFTGGVMFAVQ